MPEMSQTAPSGNAGSPEARHLREKYRVEREKRLREDGPAQFSVGDIPRHFLDDPHAAPGFARPALTGDTDVLIIGGGLGGLLAGARLRQAGVTSIRIIERGGDFGGTWYWNRYPGIACDVDSYIYMPLLEELGTMPTEKYARGREIFAHCQAIGRHFDLYRGACFQTSATSVVWHEEAARWQVSTDRGDAFRARFVVTANGLFNRPKLPRIPGFESFAGRSFHTSRWDYAYTGGDQGGNLTGLRDKMVGVIGTGATAIQCIPMLAAAAAHLYVFQRTPSSVDVRGNRPTDPQWVKTLTPGWQRRRMHNWSSLMGGAPQDEDLVGDAWTDVIHEVFKENRGAGEDFWDLMQRADDRKMEQVRARVDAIVHDRATAEALKPWYSRFCKRPCFHDAYLDVFNQPNVTLVDTGGQGVERITPAGAVVNGQEILLDCLIFATGFDVDLFDLGHSGYELRGRDGITLAEKWADGPSTLHAVQSRGFPNLFSVSIVQAGLVVNVPHLLDEQSIHIAYIVKQCMERQIRSVEPSEAAEAAYATNVTLNAFLSEKARAECTPGYYTKEGTLSRLPERHGFYEGGCIAYFRLLEAWRAENALRGLELTFAPGQGTDAARATGPDVQA